MSRADAHPYRPDHAIAPGETLRRQLDAIELSQADLAARSGLSTKHVNQIVQGIAPITLETALALERVTGLPATVWNRLEADYREALLRDSQRDLSKQDIKWIEMFPIKELQRAGHLPRKGDTASIYEALLAFFGVADRRAWETVWLSPVASFKRTNAFRSEPGAVAAWLRLGQIKAREVETAPYSATEFKRALDKARLLTRVDDFDTQLVRLAAEAGVAVVFAAEIGECRLSGAAWWGSPRRAVIGLSDRYKREDSFWFSFFHEAAHILLHSKKETFIDDGSADDQLEDEANRFAANILIPPAAARELPLLHSDADVLRFAKDVGISPGIVVGRLHNDKHWSWGRGNHLRRSLRIED